MTSAALRSRAWKLLEMVTTPLLPSDYLDLVSPLRAGADLRGRIEAVHPETGSAATIVIRPGRGWRGHTAGQYVRIGVDVDGVRLWRAYSVTSPTNRQDGRVTITVKAIPDGKVSNHLVRRAKPGTLIQLDQATGDFVLPQAKPAKVLYLTALQRHHACDGHAARHRVRRRRHGPLRATAARRDLPQRTARPGRGQEAAAHRGAHRHRRHARHRPSRRTRARLGRARDLGLRARGPARRRRGALDRARRPRAPAHRTLPPQHRCRRATAARSRSAPPARPSTRTAPRRCWTSARRPACSCRPGAVWASASAASRRSSGAVRDLRTGEITEAEPGVLIQTCVSAAASPCDIER